MKPSDTSLQIGWHPRKKHGSIIVFTFHVVLIKKNKQPPVHPIQTPFLNPPSMESFGSVDQGSELFLKLGFAETGAMEGEDVNGQVWAIQARPLRAGRRVAGRSVVGVWHCTVPLPVVWWGCGSMVCWVCMVCMVGLVWHVWKVWHEWLVIIVWVVGM